MKKLSDALRVLPDEERLSALSYYEEYFNDAEDEERAVVELGTPEYVARTILEDFRELSAEPEAVKQEAPPQYEPGYNTRPPRSDGTSKLLLILVLVLLSPLIIAVGIPVIAVLFAAVVIVICAIGAIAVAGVACVATGIFAIFYSMVRYPFFYAGMAAIGGGLASVGIGIFLTIFGVWACWKVFPALIRGCVNVCRIPFNRRKAGAK